MQLERKRAITLAVVAFMAVVAAVGILVYFQVFDYSRSWKTEEGKGAGLVINIKSRSMPVIVGTGVVLALMLVGLALWLMIRDLRERERVAAALIEAEAKYRLLFERNPQPMWVYDLESLQFLDVNEAAVATYGYSRDEFLGMTLKDIRPAEDVPALLEYVAKPTGTFQECGTWRHRKRDGKVIDVEITEHTIAYEGTPVGLVLARDVTERQLLEKQLRQAQKMEAIGSLAGGIAHDFNNILNVVSGYSELIAQRLSPSDPSHRMANEIQRSVERAAGLTKQLLVFSREQVVEHVALNLNEVCADMEEMVRRVIGEDIEITTNFRSSLWSIKADPGQLEQVLLNLVVNARHAMPSGGRLSIETSNLDVDESYARVHVDFQPGTYVLLTISDTGIGMSQEVQARIFEPFFTTKGQGKGTGLGLSTAYGIVKQSGGHIYVYSELGVGTTFKLYFPRVEDESMPTVATTAVTGTPTGNETLLLVEDQKELREVGRIMLESKGYHVLEAGTGDDAIALAGEYKQPIHLVITDMVLPGIGGRQTAERLTVLHPESKVLFMSGYADDQLAAGNGGVHFLQKPFTLHAVAIRVRDILDSREHS